MGGVLNMGVPGCSQEDFQRSILEPNKRNVRFVLLCEANSRKLGKSDIYECIFCTFCPVLKLILFLFWWMKNCNRVATISYENFNLNVVTNEFESRKATRKKKISNLKSKK